MPDARLYILFEWNDEFGGGYPWLVTADLDQAFEAGNALLNDAAGVFASATYQRSARALGKLGATAIDRLMSKMKGHITHAKIVEMSGPQIEREWTFDLFEGTQWKLRLVVQPTEIPVMAHHTAHLTTAVNVLQDYVHVPMPVEVRKATLIEAAENIMTRAVSL